MLLQQDLKEFIELLNQNKVEYLLIGGWAYSFYAIPRYTGDFDFFVNPSLKNSKKLKKTFDEFGLDSLGLKEDSFASDNKILQFGTPPTKIDILTSIRGIEFQEAWSARVEGQIDSIKIWLISKEHLIKNKQSVARPQDLADIDNLMKS